MTPGDTNVHCLSTVAHQLSQAIYEARVLAAPITRQPPQSTTVVTLTSCGCSHPQWNCNSGTQQAIMKVVETSHTAVLCRKSFFAKRIIEMIPRKTRQARFIREVLCFIHCSKAARCNIFAIVSVRRVCQIFEQHRFPSQVSRNNNTH